jgi:TonB-dependent receptor
MNAYRAHLLTAAAATALMTIPTLASAQTSSSTAPADNPAAQPSDAPAVGEIVVTGFRQSLQNAQNIKRNASQIVDSIVAEDIGKLPDNNVSEALQRIPGIQITRNHGEGSGIAIRGLTQVKTLVNGREIFSDNGRDLTLEDIPAEVLAGVDVYKNPSSSLIEGGLGGVIDLKTRRPFDFKGFEASISAGSDYYDLAKKAEPQISALVSDRFETGAGEIGVLFGAAYIRSAGRLDQSATEPFQDRYNITDFNNNGVFAGRGAANSPAVDPGDDVIAPNGGGDSIEYTTRSRLSLNGVVQWKPSDTLDLYVEGIYNKYDYNQDALLAYANRGPLLAADGAQFTFYPGTNVVKSGTYRDVEFTANTNYMDRRAYTGQIAGGGTWHPVDRLKVTTDVAYTKSKRTDRSGGLRVGNNGNTTGTTLDFDTSGSLTTLDLHGFDFGDISKYKFIDSSTSIEKVNSNEIAARLDATYSFDSSFIKDITIGGRYSRREVNREQGTQAHFLNPQPSSLDPDLFQPMEGGGNFFLNTNIPQPIDLLLAPTIAQVHDTAHLCAIFGDTVCYPSFNPANTYSQAETTYAGYAQIDLDFDRIGVPIDGNIGGRFVHTELATDGVITAPGGGTTPINQTSSYNNFLPSANLRYKFTRNLFLRLAAAKQLTRPDFSNLSPTLNVGSASAGGVLSISAGNPNLKPLKSTSYDASLEWYFSRSGYVYVDGFLKKVNGFIQNVVTRETINLADYPNYDLADITRPQNGSHGTIKGFEVGTQTFFDFLPAPFDGFGVQANYTFVQSKAPGPIVGQTVPLQGLSKHSYNLVGFYEKGVFRARVAYNWRGGFVETTSGPGSGALPIYDKPLGVLDASIGFKFNKQVDLSIDASNLTHAKTSSYFGEVNRPRFNNIFDRRIGFVLRVSY